MAISFDYVDKLINVSTDVEVTVQELLNAIRVFEASVQGIDEDQIASAAGKEDLGGGTKVGITLTLLNGWRVKFEDRAGPDWIVCNISGGNLVSVDSDNVSQFPIAPAPYVTATLTASASATLQEQGALQYASFDGGVTVDIKSSYTGTGFPKGTPEQPVNNMIDALTIATERGFTRLYIENSMTFDSDAIISGFEIIGRNHATTKLTINTEAEVDRTIIHNSHITGILDGAIEIRDSLVEDLEYVNGHIEDCGLMGTITLAGSSDDAIFVDCSTVDPNKPPTINMGGNGLQDAAITDYSGIITIDNMSGSDMFCGVGLDAGRVYITSDVTAGTIWVSGTGELFNSASSDVIVITNGLLSLSTIADAVWDEDTGEHTTTDTFAELAADILKLLGNDVTASGDIISILDTDGGIWRQYDLSSDGRVQL